MPGVVAHARPLDAAATAAYVDTFGAGVTLAAVRLVRERVVRVDNFAIDEGAGRVVPFDPKSELHVRTLPRKAHIAIYDALIERAGLTKDQEKNSESPSGSVPMTDGNT